MTLARGSLQHREAPRRRGAPKTLAGVLARSLRAVAAELQPVQTSPAAVWPSERWRADPRGFGYFILGVELWDRQVEILEAVRDEMLTAVRGGRKVGKDFVLAVLALWFYCSFPAARVRFTAVTDQQVNDVFWREVRMMLAGHGRCVDCKKTDPAGPRPCPHSAIIPEEPGLLARTGLRSADFREIVGFTAREAEGAAGLSGPYQLNIADEASGLEDFFFEAVLGNMAGCLVGRLALISNPTRNKGEFAEAFKGSSKYRQIHVSSRTTPNVIAGRTLIPGLATREWVEMMVEKYGEGSAFVKIHVDGDFATSEAGTIFDVPTLDEAMSRWPTTAAEGPLYIGVDPAGDSGAGDESGFAARRGDKVLEVRAKLGLSAEQHLLEALMMIARHGAGSELPSVVIDRGGETGSKVYGVFVAHLQENWKDPPFRLVGVRSSDKAMRDPKSYDRVRDELIASLAEWIRDGGALPDDARLAVELHAFRWQEQRVETKNKLVDKVKMRSEIGRSPDRADAVALSCWRPREAAIVVNTNKPPPTQKPTQNPYGTTRVFDPYRALDPFIPRR